MASKLTFALGLGAGYVLGARAGRAQYERIKATAAKVAEKPFVREKVDAASTRASQFVREQGEAVTDKLVETVKDRLFGGSGARSESAGAKGQGTAGAPVTPVTVDDAEVRSI